MLGKILHVRSVILLFLHNTRYEIKLFSNTQNVMHAVPKKVI